MRRPFVRWLGWTGLFLVLLGVASYLPRRGFIADLNALLAPGTYLVIFENDAELRPGGGFIGSYALVTVRSSGSVGYQVETNIYKQDLPFTERRPIAAPDGLVRLTPTWALRDANWEMDFLDAARTIEWFLVQEGGPPVDGVVALTARGVTQLLAELGPLTLNDGSLLTSENFYDTLAYQIEKAYFLTSEARTENEPKQLLVSLAPQLLKRVALPWNTVKTIDWAREMLNQKQIVLSLADSARQDLVVARHWGGQINRTSRHYVAVVNANLGGRKSSRHMKQTVTADITASEPDVASYHLVVTRTHTGTGEWPDHKNDNLTSVLVPNGATIRSATLNGSSVSAEASGTTAGRQWYGFRVDTPPGETYRLELSLVVPTDLALDPLITWQKQPGVASDRVVVTYDGRVVLDDEYDQDQTVAVP